MEANRQHPSSSHQHDLAPIANHARNAYFHILCKPKPLESGKYGQKEKHPFIPKEGPLSTHMSIILQPANDHLENRLKAARAGDNVAFEAILDQYQAQVFDLASLVLGNPVEAEDITQDVFIKFIHHLPNLTATKNLEGWFYKVTLNHCRNYLRKHRRQKQLSQEQADVLPAPTDQHVDQKRWLASHLGHLSFKERSALILVHILGFSTAESAKILNCRAGTIKALCFRGRKKLIQIRDREAAYGPNL